MSIALSEEHRELATVARAFLADCDVRREARELLEAETDRRPSFWTRLAELGWLGLHVDENYGGAGYGLPELVVVVEQLGRAIAPGPFLSTVIASALLNATGGDDLKSRLLPTLINGSRTAAVGLDGGVNIDSDGKASGDGGIVFGAAGADLLLLAAGDDVVLVEAGADGVVLDQAPSLDQTRRSARVSLRGVVVERSCVLAGARSAATAIARTLIAADAAGGAADCVDKAVEYAKVREQFGRTIATFQAIKHHCANMLVSAEVALATVWDAARAAGSDDNGFKLMAAAAAALALPAYAQNAELNIQVHGGIGFTWEHDAHIHLRRALTLRALFGGDGPAADVYALSAAGTTRENTLDLPAGAEDLRRSVRGDVERIAAFEGDAQCRKLIETGYIMPHWPKPWGRAADAVEQVVIEQEFAKAGVKRPDYSITGWVVLTLIQHGTESQIDRFVEKALLQEEVWCQLFSEPGAGSDAAAISTRATRVEGGGVSTVRSVDQRRPLQQPRPGHRAHGPQRDQARRYHHGHHRYERPGSRDTATPNASRKCRVQRGISQRRIRARRGRGR